MNDKKQPGPHKKVQDKSFTLKRAILAGTTSGAVAGALAAANKAFKAAIAKKDKPKKRD